MLNVSCWSILFLLHLVFIYIYGVLLCQQYVNSSSKFSHSEMDSIALLEQALKGLAYLHSIGIGKVTLVVKFNHFNSVVKIISFIKKRLIIFVCNIQP